MPKIAGVALYMKSDYTLVCTVYNLIRFIVEECLIFKVGDMLLREKIGSNVEPIKIF